VGLDNKSFSRPCFFTKSFFRDFMSRNMLPGPVMVGDRSIRPVVAWPSTLEHCTFPTSHESEVF
jgi:hypothetical protein